MFNPYNYKDYSKDDSKKYYNHKDEGCWPKIDDLCEDKKHDDHNEECKRETECVRNYDKCCVTVNIYCDDSKYRDGCREETKYSEDSCRETYKREYDRKYENSYVTVNIFCDKAKEPKYKEYDYNTDCKKEYGCKDDTCCVNVNIFCDKGKREYKC